MEPQARYVRLRRLIEAMPQLTQVHKPEVQKWLGQAAALLEASSPGGSIRFNGAMVGLRSPLAATSYAAAQEIAVILYAALAAAELEAPAEMQGAFIPVGNAFDVANAVSKVLGQARMSVLIVDPYMDDKTLTDFCTLAAESIKVRLLSDARDVKPSLEPTARRWVAQYGPARPLEVRLAPARVLHDRLVITDDARAWTIGQSLKDLAVRSPTSIGRVDDDTAALKVQAYRDIWAAAAPVPLT